MKKFKKSIISALICIVLFQPAMTTNIGGAEKIYAETMSQGIQAPPITPTPTAVQQTARMTMPAPFIIRGNIKTDVDCNQEAQMIVNAGFVVSGGTYNTKTDQTGAFSTTIQYQYMIKGNITIEKPGFLKRTIKDIVLQQYTTYLNDIPMWAGDVNGDNNINIADCISLASRFNSIKGDGKYLADADLNMDDTINMSDLVYIARHFNATPESYPPYVQINSTPTPVTGTPASTTPTPTQIVTPTPTPVVSSTPTPDLSGLEIEKKFLIDKSKIPYDLSTFDKYELEQAYISFSPEVRIRKVDDWMFFLTVKAYVDDLLMTREEREFWITEQEYNTLMKKTEGNLIYKTRYQGLDENGVMFAIDIFKGNLAGLAYYEVEFPNEEEANKFTPPAWVGKDVTNDKRYKNGSLAQFGIPKE